MSEEKQIRLSKVAKEFNIGVSTIVEFLLQKGYKIDNNPNNKITSDLFDILVKEFQSDKTVKEKSQKIGLEYIKNESVTIDNINIKKDGAKKEDIIEKGQEDLLIKDVKTATADSNVKKEYSPSDKTQQKGLKEKEAGKVKIIGKIDLETVAPGTKQEKDAKGKKPGKQKSKSADEKQKEKLPQEDLNVENLTDIKISTEEVIGLESDTKEILENDNFIKTEIHKLKGPTIVGKILLPAEQVISKHPGEHSSSDEFGKSKKKKRKRIKKDFKSVPEKSDRPIERPKFKKKKEKKRREKVEISEEDVNQKIKETLARLGGTGKSKASKYRKQKREAISQVLQEKKQKTEEEKKVIKVTEFVTANELASMMDVPVTEVISVCMSLGLVVSINQRLDAETLTIVAEEFGYKLNFVSVEVQESITIEDNVDDESSLEGRAPIVTVMGHVDHGKTSLLDYIRKTNVIAGEAGGITQHIGAYEVKLENGKKITFLDTPGHEAFTAMRARGTKITDIAIIVIAADDNIMPQTIEAINHAQAANVPIIVAINKIDKSNANIDRIKEGLSKINILVEDWGGKHQCQEISAKKGINIDLLLEKVVLEAEMLDLKANPSRKALGTVIESSLDKGKGYVAKLLVQNGTLKTGDIIIAGCCYGRVKAMYNERNILLKEARPSSPVLLLGLNDAPQAGDTFHVMSSDHEAKTIATKRQQLQREQGLRTQKHITLDEIGRRIAIGDFKELNIIVKGDVDGSVEALSDSLLKLSNQEIQVNVIHKSVGQISESDILLASASNAIVVGFQVRPSVSARKLAEHEQIDVRLYSVIYNAIEEIKDAIEGMLSPEIEEKIKFNAEVRELFVVSKVGTIAGCMVVDGKATSNSRVRLIRDGIVVYSGQLSSLRRFKEDVREVKTGYDCGMTIDKFNDFKVGDIIEGFEEVEVQRKL